MNAMAAACFMPKNTCFEARGRVSGCPTALQPPFSAKRQPAGQLFSLTASMTRPTLRTTLRVLLSLLFIAAGINHF